MSGTTIAIKTEHVGSFAAGSTRLFVVKFLVLAVLALCMSAPEEILAPATGENLNPYAGTMKLLLLGLGCALVFLCRSGTDIKVLASPFRWLIIWAIICWLLTGAGLLPLRNLISSFGGILVLAGLCGAAKALGGARALVNLMVWVLVLVAVASVALGLLGIQAMPGEIAVAGQLELFHGIGLAAYAEAACAALIAWVLGRHLAGPGVWLEPAIMMLLVIPVFTFLRTYMIGIVVSMAFAAVMAWWLSRRKRRRVRRTYNYGYKRLLFLVAVTLLIGAAVFLLKTGTREEGEELSGREIIWPIEILSIIRHPFFGLGPFGDVQLLFFDENLPQVGAAHSDFLGAAVCYGIPGLLIFCGVLYSLWRRILRFGAVSIEERACRYAALISLVGLSTTMIAENVIRDPRLFSLHLLFPALCLSASAASQKKAEK